MEIGAGKFKALCLQLMDRVHDTHERIVITKHGKPVAQMVWVEEQKPQPLFGRLRGTVLVSKDLVGFSPQP
ncbi:MAG: type II toxin-antitoxin system prevent-host-death family antitoxin [Spirochaetaceae bacterium]|nr:MAG: type II toxin-antitoxin system prevent-host-death family antitoxin [Spirochaetaceae bacterium]